MLHRPRLSPPVSAFSNTSFAHDDDDVLSLLLSPMSISSPLLFEFDDSDFLTLSPTSANPDDLVLKPEPDLTIRLGWDNDALSGSIPRPSSDNRYSGSIYAPAPRSDSSAQHSVSAPPLAPTSAFNDTSSFSSNFWSNDYLSGLDNLGGDPKAFGQYPELLMNNANTSIPWGQWTNVNGSDIDTNHTRDDLDMPPTPVDAFSINVDLYHSNGSSDLVYSQVCNSCLTNFVFTDLSGPYRALTRITISCHHSIHLDSAARLCRLLLFSHRVSMKVRRKALTSCLDLLRCIIIPIQVNAIRRHHRLASSACRRTLWT